MLLHYFFGQLPMSGCNIVVSVMIVETQKWIENEVKTSENPFLVKRQKMSILVLLMWCTQFLFAFFPELIWPGVSKLPDFKSQFPRWEPQSLDLILPRTLSDQGKDLFKVSLTWTNTTKCKAVWRFLVAKAELWVLLHFEIILMHICYLVLSWKEFWKWRVEYIYSNQYWREKLFPDILQLSTYLGC